MPEKNKHPNHPTTPYDPIKYAKQLENVGFTRAQAELQSETLFSMAHDQWATKQDLKDLKQDLQGLEGRLTHAIENLDVKTKTEIAFVRRDIKELDSKNTLHLELLRRDLKVWLGGMLISLVAIFSTILTVLPLITAH